MRLTADPVRRITLVPALLGALLAASAAGAQPATLLRSSLPGAFGVRYLPDRAVVSYTVAAPGERGVAESFRLQVRLPEPIRWAYLDGERLPESSFTWLAYSGQAQLSLPFGNHRLHVGWSGEPYLPPERAAIPVLVGGREVGRLKARFTLDGMDASGEVPVGPGIATLRLETAGELAPPAVTLSVAGADVGPLVATDRALRPAGTLLVPEATTLALSVRAYGLRASPVRRVVFDSVSPPTVAQRVADDTAPAKAMLIEAEDFVASGGTPVKVEPGSHLDAHGDACVFNFAGDGAWLEWDLQAPTAGAYDLYARIANAEPMSFRSLSLDGVTPPGLELVAFPGTGGWGHAPGEWWLVRLTGADGLAPPLQLTVGAHRLRITGVLEKHLNFDYLLLAPRS